MLTNFYLFLICFFCDNILLAYGIGTKKLITDLEKFDFKNMGKNTFMLSITSILTAVILYAIKSILKLKIVHAKVPLLLFFCSVISYFFLNVMISRSSLKSDIKQTKLLTTIFDPLVWGMNLICIYKNYTLPHSVCFLLAGSIGYVLLSNFIRFNQTQLNDDKIPSCFKGVPILLIYIGILSLAYCGFVNNQSFI
jgi:Na+-translocating ferredoxin:NAD+ oxidoreductase RnfA subunit